MRDVVEEMREANAELDSSLLKDEGRENLRLQSLSVPSTEMSELASDVDAVLEAALTEITGCVVDEEVNRIDEEG